MKSLRGRVIDDTGRPLAAAQVVLLPAGASSGSNERQTVRTDEDGAFSFEAIADGAYTVIVFGFETPDAGQYHVPGENITIRVERGGVIAGRVTGPDGEPLIGVPVVAKCIRGKGDAPLQSPYSYEFSRSRITDDRGIYRFWSLQPGTYVVWAGPSNFGGAGLATLYDNDSPTYYPSSTLASAKRLVLDSGQELTGIDISYRGYTGHTISGTATGNTSPSHLQVYLAARDGDYLDGIWPEADQSSFAFARVSDGEYLLMATLTSGNELVAISLPRPITVKGADVTGINLKPVPLGSLSGSIILEYNQALDCKNKTNNTLAETVLALRRTGPSNYQCPEFIEAELSYRASPNSKGNFLMKRVPAGDYRIDSWLPTDDWYVGAIDLGARATGASATGARATGTGSGLRIREGQAVSGLNVTIKNGAAGLSGRITRKAAAATLPSGLRVYLTPAEPDRARDRLRFFETEAGNDGSFKFKNLPPGTYRIIARAIKDEDSAKPAADTIEGRARLLREAEARNQVVELRSCERRADYFVKP